MEQEDISYYLVADKLPTEGILKKILNTCEAVDFTGTPESTFYNGLEGFCKEAKLEFEISPEDAIKESEEHIHSNFTFLEWHNDELLNELAGTLEEMADKVDCKIDSISLLNGIHEILSLHDNSIKKSNFSFAFYFDVIPDGTVADLNLMAEKNPNLQEQIQLLEQICGCKFKGFFGGS